MHAIGSFRPVVPPAPERTEAEQATRKARKLSREPTRDTPGWADLLLRVFGEDVLVCRHCRGPLTLRAVVVHPPATTRILDGLARARPPPLFTGP